MIIKKYTQFLIENVGGYKYGCVMVEVPVNNWDEITSWIDPNDVYESKGDSTYGIQKNPHLTLLYGLHDDVTPEMVKNVISKYKNDIHIEVDGIGIFENSDFDVVKFNVNPDGTLQKLFNELSELPNSNEYPEYKPHITISYVKRGMGKKYVKPDYKYAVKNVDKVCYSMTNGEKVYFNIGNFSTESLEHRELKPILERRGIPNIVKFLYKEITENIISHIELGEEIKKFNLLRNDITISLNNLSISDIRGKSSNNLIELSFNFDDFNKNELQRVVLHELIHVYEINKRSKGNSNMKLQWDVNDILRNIEGKYNDQFISELCYLIYLSFDHEINARVADVYPLLIGLNTNDKDMLLRSLKNSRS
jgi:2'-5' RNA ligase